MGLTPQSGEEWPILAYGIICTLSWLVQEMHMTRIGQSESMNISFIILSRMVRKKKKVKVLIILPAKGKSFILLELCYEEEILERNQYRETQVTSNIRWYNWALGFSCTFTLGFFFYVSQKITPPTPWN